MLQKSRGFGRSLVSLLAGTLIGAGGMLGYFYFFTSPPQVRLQGTVILDTSSPENLYLTNAIYLENPTAFTDRIYLNFQDDATLNASLSKTLIVSGYLRTVNIGDGESITELKVSKVEPVQP